MIIGVDASRALRARRTGTENYSLQLIRGLLQYGREHSFRLYTDRQPAPALFDVGGRSQIRVMPFPRLWTHGRLSWEMMRHPPEVLFVPAHVLPLVSPERSVATIHDLGFLQYPEAHPAAQRAYLRWSTRWNVRQSAHLLVDSQATRADLRTYWSVPEDRMTVVYPGRDESLHPVTDSAVLARVRDRHGLRTRYVLHVGTLQPRKNLVRLVEAFARLGDSGLQLVLVGKKGWMSEAIFRRVAELGVAESVRFLGYVSGEDLPALLSAAACFAFPSLYEGFGFPVLEAQACGTPVVASAASSVPEVAGSGALLCDPRDTEALAEALQRVLEDESLRSELMAHGFRNVERFSWERCARETLAVLEAVGGAR